MSSHLYFHLFHMSYDLHDSWRFANLNRISLNVNIWWIIDCHYKSDLIFSSISEKSSVVKIALIKMQKTFYLIIESKILATNFRPKFQNRVSSFDIYFFIFWKYFLKSLPNEFRCYHAFYPIPCYIILE